MKMGAEDGVRNTHLSCLPHPHRGQTFEVKETEQRLSFPPSALPSSGQERTLASLGRWGDGGEERSMVAEAG